MNRWKSRGTGEVDVDVIRKGMRVCGVDEGIHRER